MSTQTPFAPPAPNLSGLVLDGRYELETLVGEGAFGHVYRGLDRRLDRTVAVKLIKPWWISDPGWVRAFEREARLLARVNDPGIVQIFDVGRAPESLYYVTEFVDGESLARRLSHGPLDPREACEIAEQLSRALGGAHAQGVVHRDIKPANVLLTTDGRVKLGDFGVARLAEDAAEGSSSAVIAGTPKYMAPEHARGKPTTPASDTYSVGVVLYEMLAGVPPFAGSAAVELALRHLKDDPPPLPSSTPPELAAVAMRALAKDPVDRYRDGHALEAALGQARRSAELKQRGAPTVRLTPEAEASPDATRREPKRTRRNYNPPERRRSIAAIGVALCVLAGLGLGAVLLAAPSRARIPRLTGLSRAAVLAAAHRSHIHAVFSSRSSAGAAAGTAIGQAPSPGRWVDSGSAVRVLLSSGPPPVELPELEGQSSTSASSILSSLGLRAGVTPVPAPGTQPGTVTAQSPAAGKYVRAHSKIALSVAETPSWRPVTSFAGTDQGQSVAFRIRGDQFRVVYRMGFVGTCTFILFCDGPTANVVRPSDGSTLSSFGLNSGDNQTQVVKSGPGVYEIKIQPGNDTASWSIEVEDYY